MKDNKRKTTKERHKIKTTRARQQKRGNQSKIIKARLYKQDYTRKTTDNKQHKKHYYGGR